jgi:hypothetical protein
VSEGQPKCGAGRKQTIARFVHLKKKTKNEVGEKKIRENVNQCFRAVQWMMSLDF